MILNKLNNLTSLNKTELSIIEYLEAAILNNEDVTIRNVAKATFSSPTTIYRAVKKLGFNGYSEMIYHFKESARSDNKNIDLEFLDSLLINFNHEILCDFCALMEQVGNNKIALIGLDYSGIVSDYISRRLSLIGFNVYLGNHFDVISNSKNQEEVKLLITVSKSGETSEIMRMVENARKYAINVLSFVGSTDSSIARNSSLPLVVDIPHNPLSSYNGEVFYGKAILVFETLLEYYLKNKNQ